jgi:hypothetical protein
MTRAIIGLAAAVLIAAGLNWVLSRSDRLQDEINNRDTLERMNEAIDDNLGDDVILDSLRALSK